MTLRESSAEDPGLRASVQRAGRFLSGMVMPNIGAFIAWGLITALFIPVGWLPNAQFARLVAPMITWLLPLLIGYTGGRMVYETRGGVIGAIATAGVVVGAEIPMLMGAMVVGPSAAWVLRGLDRRMERLVRPGFEMLVQNFSLGIVGGALALIACVMVGPLLAAMSRVLASGVNACVEARLLPFAHLLIEPGKVLFLNNAINHGIIGPLALTQSAESGRSILFLLETNPGPGLGILLASSLFGVGASRTTAPAAIVIHFMGGIHEIYFPYVLMYPRLIVAAIAGGIAATTWFVLLSAGLVAMPSPGSIFAYVAMAPRGEMTVVLSGVALATVVSFVVAAALLKFSGTVAGQPNLAEAREKLERLKGAPLYPTPIEVTNETSGLGPAVPAMTSPFHPSEAGTMTPRPPWKIVFACDAGMGSSAMGASILRQKLQRAGLEARVTHAAVGEIPLDADLIITHRTLIARARGRAGSAEHLAVDDFLKSPVYDEIVQRLQRAGSARRHEPVSTGGKSDGKA